MLRALRVMRMLKLFKHMTALRQIAQVLVTCVMNYVGVGLILLLLWVVFAILGLHIYGDVVPDMKGVNFSNMVNSLAFIFQVCSLTAN